MDARAAAHAHAAFHDVNECLNLLKNKYAEDPAVASAIAATAQAKGLIGVGLALLAIVDELRGLQAEVSNLTELMSLR